MKKILILPMYGIGDVLMTTPALKNLKEQTDAEINFLHMFRTTRDILQHNPHITENIFFPFLEAGKAGSLSFLLQFRNKFDCTINFYPSNRRDYNLASFIIGSPVRIGHRYVRRNFAELNFLKNTTVKENDSLHNVEENLRLLELLDIKTKPNPLKVYLSEEEMLFAQNWLKERAIDKRLLIGIHSGTSTFKNHDKKRWPEASFAKLIDRLSSEIDGPVFLLFGGPEEKPLKEAVARLADKKDMVISVDSLTIRQAASLIGNCLLFITNDSGLMHIAAAMRVPVAAIFGPTNPVWVRPYQTEHRVVRLGLPCSPCFRYSPIPLKCPADINFACIKDLGVEQVCRACIELLKNAQ